MKCKVYKDKRPPKKKPKSSSIAMSDREQYFLLQKLKKIPKHI